jgi:hypothetical protein
MSETPKDESKSEWKERLEKELGKDKKARSESAIAAIKHLTL